MRVSLYLPLVLLCALLMSACASEEEQAQQAREADQKYAAIVSDRIENEVVARTGSSGGTVRVVCPDTVDKIVRLGCVAAAVDSLESPRIKVARTGEGDRPEDYRVVTKFFDAFHFADVITKDLSTRTRSLYSVRCPPLVEKKKGVRFVCKGSVSDRSRHRLYTVRVRATGFDDGGDLTAVRVKYLQLAG